MKKIIFLHFIIAILLSSIVYGTPPENLTYAKQAIIDYYQSGEYHSDVKNVMQDAEKYLKQKIDSNNYSQKPKKLAIVLDIDDTSLSHFFKNKKRDFSVLPELIHQNYLEANSQAIEPVLKLYNDAIKNGVSVFFISCRPEAVRSYTITNLQHAGYRDWSGLYLPNATQKKQPSHTFKTNIRQLLTKKGYTIILNIGDQESDLIGEYAEHTIKIPNPLYANNTPHPPR